MSAAVVSRSGVSRRSPELQFLQTLNRFVEPHIRAGWGSPRLVPGGVIVLETTGRRTGRRARTALAAIRLGSHILVSTFRGRRAGWVKNLSANPQARYWLGGRARQATALVISPDRRMPRRNHLPAPLQLVMHSLAPYTYAGWAFAVLQPETTNGTPRRARRERSQ